MNGHSHEGVATGNPPVATPFSSVRAEIPEFMDIAMSTSEMAVAELFPRFARHAMNPDVSDSQVP